MCIKNYYLNLIDGRLTLSPFCIPGTENTTLSNILFFHHTNAGTGLKWQYGGTCNKHVLLKPSNSGQLPPTLQRIYKQLLNNVRIKLPFLAPRE